MNLFESHCNYVHSISESVCPLLSKPVLSLDDLNTEIIHVSKVIKKSSLNNLPHVSQHRKKKMHINDAKLTSLCKTSREDWISWNKAGRGTLYEEKKEISSQICCYLSCQKRKNYNPEL